PWCEWVPIVHTDKGWFITTANGDVLHAYQHAIARDLWFVHIDEFPATWGYQLSSFHRVPFFFCEMG
ncbi:MAG: hypothetical protein ACI8PG_003953, partial [Planctomycetota bacterium]